MACVPPQELEPELVGHMVDVGCPPLRLAFPWMVHAFVGALAIDQLLWLWDRVIGFESLYPVAMLAVAVVRFRKTALLGATTLEGMRAAVDDLEQMRVMPLLQSLFL